MKYDAADLEKGLCTQNLAAVDARLAAAPANDEKKLVIGGRFGGFSFDAVFATWKTSKCIFNAAQAQPKRTHARALLFSCFAEETNKK